MLSLNQILKRTLRKFRLNQILKRKGRNRPQRFHHAMQFIMQQKKGVLICRTEMLLSPKQRLAWIKPQHKEEIVEKTCKIWWHRQLQLLVERNYMIYWRTRAKKQHEV